MSKHDLKAEKLQVKSLDSKVQEFIEALVAIRMASSDIDLSHPLALVTKAYVDSATGNGVSVLAPWLEGESVFVDYYRTHPIDGIEYLFRSLINDNTSEPTLEPTTGAWIQTEIFGFISTWTDFVSYNSGSLVTGDSNANVYRSLIDGNENNNPNGGLNPDEWELVGAYRGFYGETVYNLGDVVIAGDESNRVYISNISDNDQPLTNIVTTSTWQLIGPLPGSDIDALTFTETDLVEVYEGNYSLSFNLPDGKSIASIETKAGTVTRRLNPSQAVTDTANNPNTVIEGFDNNSAQTITIKLI